MQLRFYHLSLLWIKIRAFIHSFKNNRYLKYFTWREPCGQEAGVNLKPPMGHSPGCAPEGGLLWPCTHRPKNVSQHFLRTLCTKWKWIQWTLGKEKTQVIFHQMYSAVKANGNSAGRVWEPREHKVKFRAQNDHVEQFLLLRTWSSCWLALQGPRTCLWNSGIPYGREQRQESCSLPASCGALAHKGSVPLLGFVLKFAWIKQFYIRWLHVFI